MCSSWYNNWVTRQHARCNNEEKASGCYFMCPLSKKWRLNICRNVCTECINTSSFMCCSRRKRGQATLSTAHLELCGYFPITLMLFTKMAKGPKRVGLWKNNLCICKKNFSPYVRIFINMVFEITATITWLCSSRTLARGFARCIDFWVRFPSGRYFIRKFALQPVLPYYYYYY